MAVKNIQIRLDETLKEKAEKILHDLGLDVPTAFRLFLSKVVHSRSLPFQVSLDDEPSYKMGAQEVAELLAAYGSAKEGKDLVGPFHSADEMLDSLHEQAVCQKLVHPQKEPKKQKLRTRKALRKK